LPRTLLLSNRKDSVDSLQHEINHCQPSSAFSLFTPSHPKGLNPPALHDFVSVGVCVCVCQWMAEFCRRLR